MKLIVKMILTAMLLCLPLGADAQDVITGPKKPKKQTTAPAKTSPKKQQTNFTPQQMNAKGKEACDNSDYAEALKWYKKSAQQGNAVGQYELGYMYEMGCGVKSYSEAVKWYRKAAEQGDSKAPYRLGWLYQNGYGVAKDSFEAVKWFRKSAEQGNSDAQSSLGYMYLNGYGVAKDLNEAKRWYQKAAEQGDMAAKQAFEWLNGR